MAVVITKQYLSFGGLFMVIKVIEAFKEEILRERKM